MTEVIDASLDELDKVADRIRQMLPESAVIFLRGDLAAGKTTLVKALAKAKGCERDVTSPRMVSTTTISISARMRNFCRWDCWRVSKSRDGI